MSSVSPARPRAVMYSWFGGKWGGVVVYCLPFNHGRRRRRRRRMRRRKKRKGVEDTRKE